MEEECLGFLLWFLALEIYNPCFLLSLNSNNIVSNSFPQNHSYRRCHATEGALLMSADVSLSAALIMTSLCFVPRPCRAHWAAVSSRSASSQWSYPTTLRGLVCRLFSVRDAVAGGSMYVSRGASHQPTQMRRLNETKLALPKTTGLGICWELIIWNI